MDFEIKPLTIGELIELYESRKLELNPPYQRNDIWTQTSKKRLIESVKLGYPLPTFFFYKRNGETIEVVDGQQRTRTFLGYVKGLFPDTNNEYFENSDKEYLLHKYKLVCVFMSNESPKIKMEDFYYRVNRFGTKLNRPEILKAQFYNSFFQTFVKDLAENSDFQNLQIFTASSINRMNDLDFIGELVALLKFGITEKKKGADKLYENDNLIKPIANHLKDDFIDTLHILSEWNEYKPINMTRYRQKGDFYTLFGFLHNNKELSKDLLLQFYKILVAISSKISPSNENCFALREYATNCVSQSNSSRARKERNEFFTHLLLNTEPDPLSKRDSDDKNEILIDIMEYYHIQSSELKKYEGFYILDHKLIYNREPHDDI